MVHGGQIVPDFKQGEKHSRDLQKIGSEVGEAYFLKKDVEDELAELRLEFFLGATLAQSVETLARKVVRVPDSITTEEAARAFVERYNSGWRIVEGQEIDGVREISIEEDPGLQPYSIVVEVEDGVVDKKDKKHPGYVITKTIVVGSLMLDDERLMTENLDLYYEVTEYAQYDSLLSIVSNFGGEDKLSEVLDNMHWQRVPKNPDDLTPEQSEKIKEYSFEGPKQLRLNVNYAKPEELGEG